MVNYNHRNPFIYIVVTLLLIFCSLGYVDHVVDTN